MGKCIASMKTLVYLTVDYEQEKDKGAGWGCR
jgi:hypothetical protein